MEVKLESPRSTSTAKKAMRQCSVFHADVVAVVVAVVDDQEIFVSYVLCRPKNVNDLARFVDLRTHLKQIFST